MGAGVVVNAPAAWARVARSAVAALLVGCALAGCTAGPEPRPASPTSRPAEPVAPARVVTKANSGGGPHGFRFEVSCPQLTGMRSPLQEHRLNTLLLREAMSIVDKQRRVVERYRLRSDRMRVDYQVRLHTDRVLSVLFAASVSSPHAVHEVHEFVSISLSLRDGRQLTLADSFLEGANYIEPLIFGTVQRLHDQLGDDAVTLEVVPDLPDRPAGGQKAGALRAALDGLDLERRFLLGRGGVEFSWPMCVLASCAAGDVSVTVPYGELRGLIDEDGPLSGIA